MVGGPVCVCPKCMLVRVGARVGPGGLPSCAELIRAGGQLLVSAAHEFASLGRVRVAACVCGRLRQWSAAAYSTMVVVYGIMVRAWCPGGSRWSPNLRGVDPRVRTVAGRCHACVCSVGVRARGCPRGSRWSPNLRGVEPRVRTVAGRCHACVCSVGARAHGCLVRWRMRQWSATTYSTMVVVYGILVRAWCPGGSRWSPNLRGVDPRVRTDAGRCHACVW